MVNCGEFWGISENDEKCQGIGGNGWKWVGIVGIVGERVGMMGNGLK